MPRIAKPYLFRGWWVSKAGCRPGDDPRICPDTVPEKTARKLLQQRLAKIVLGENETAAVPAPVVAAAKAKPKGLTCGELAVRFHSWVKTHKAESTAAWYWGWLRRWTDRHGADLAVEMKPAALEEWKRELKDKGNAGDSINQPIVVVQTMWNWAVKQQLLESNPFRIVVKLPPKTRKRIATPKEFRTLLRNAADDFRRVLFALRFSGMRPGELAVVTWEMVDFKGKRIVIPATLTKTGKRTGNDRRIPLLGLLERLLRWMHARSMQTGPVFRNSLGEAWNKDSLGHRFATVRKRAKVKKDDKGENLMLYSLRHTFLTGGALAGLSDRELGDLAGHIPGSRCTRGYIHVAGLDEWERKLEAAASTATAKAMG
jgi:integrase